MKNGPMNNVVVFARKVSHWILVCLLLWSIQSVWAENEILTIEGARIRGNQELPNVLYVVPWQPPKTDALQAPEHSLASTPKLKTLERESFKRLISYHQSFKSQAEVKSDLTPR